jgi:pimeloyl-ACP methyl ester carboxylesterase
MAARALAEAPPRFALGGLSMGGYVALAMQRMAPERVTRLALLDTTARPDTEDGTARRRALMELARSGRFHEVHQALWPRLVHPDRTADKALEHIVLTMMNDTGVDAFCREQEAIIARVDSRPLLGAIACPTLVLVGAQDAITPVEMAQEMADAIPAAALAIVPETGHLATLEAPVHVNAALAKWLMR